MTFEAPLQIRRILRFGLVTNDVAGLAAFYQAAFECELRSDVWMSGTESETLVGVAGGARAVTLRLGEQSIEMLQFDTPGAPYPDPLSPVDGAFQHFAIVVSDMRLAMDRLSRNPGWTALSSGGPQRLPPQAGGVTAFKFRDPDGHPLELLEFTAEGMPAHWRNLPRTGVFRGIDHSALSVADVDASIAFYTALGLCVASRTFNHGIEQQRLDGIAAPRVDVIGLEPPLATPHLELLGYQSQEPRRRLDVRSRDLAATRLVLEAALPDPAPHGANLLQVDPDGHHLQWVLRAL